VRYDPSPKQRAAINQLRAAFKACARTHVAVFAMDDTVYVATEYDPTKDFHEQYQYEEDLTETIVIGHAFKGSGGW
jgi:hypothetical protein